MIRLKMKIFNTILTAKISDKIDKYEFLTGE